MSLRGQAFDDKADAEQRGRLLCHIAQAAAEKTRQIDDGHCAEIDGRSLAHGVENIPTVVFPACNWPDGESAYAKKGKLFHWFEPDAPKRIRCLIRLDSFASKP